MRPDAFVQKRILAVMVRMEKSWDLSLRVSEVILGLKSDFKTDLPESRVRAALERLCKQGMVGKKRLPEGRVGYFTRRSHLSEAMLEELMNLS